MSRIDEIKERLTKYHDSDKRLGEASDAEINQVSNENLRDWTAVKDNCLNDVSYLLSLNERYKEALKFYAEERRYNTDTSDSDYMLMKHDRGKTALQALEE